MKRLSIALMLLAALPAPTLAAEATETRANLTILADESLMMPLAQLTRDYATRTRTPITVVIKNTAQAEAQIEQGLEAHVIITADYPMLGRLTEQGLTDVSSRRPIARTALALVASKDVKRTLNPAKRISFASILKTTEWMPIFAPDETSIEGKRVSALLGSDEFRELTGTRLQRRTGTDDVLASMRDEEGLALLPVTASISEPDVALLSLLPESVSPAVTYDAVVLGSELMDSAKNFTTYLTSREAQSIVSHFGYQTPK